MMLLALSLAFSAFTALSLAMDKPPPGPRAHPPAPPARRLQWRVLGWGLLAAALALCVAGHGWALGPVLWLGTLTLGGIVLAFGLYPFRQHWIAPLAWALPALSLLAALLL